jgi:hypothetical protein
MLRYGVKGYPAGLVLALVANALHLHATRPS